MRYGCLHRKFIKYVGNEGDFELNGPYLGLRTRLESSRLKPKRRKREEARKKRNSARKQRIPDGMDCGPDGINEGIPDGGDINPSGTYYLENKFERDINPFGLSLLSRDFTLYFCYFREV